MGEFVIKSETTVQTISRIPLDFSESKNLLNVFDSLFWTELIVTFGRGNRRLWMPHATHSQFDTNNILPLDHVFGFFRVHVVLGLHADTPIKKSAAIALPCCSAQIHSDNNGCNILLTHTYCVTHGGRLASEAAFATVASSHAR